MSLTVLEVLQCALINLTVEQLEGIVDGLWVSVWDDDNRQDFLDSLAEANDGA